VLAEHDTTPLGEIQQGSFQGGNRREDSFFFIQFVILQFHHGVKIMPVAPPEVGHFDPEEVLWAIHRGAQSKVDMTHQWNFWPLMRLPLKRWRACHQYGLARALRDRSRPVRRERVAEVGPGRRLSCLRFCRTPATNGGKSTLTPFCLRSRRARR
jgi:hypothetical protein